MALTTGRSDGAASAATRAAAAASNAAGSEAAASPARIACRGVGERAAHRVGDERPRVAREQGAGAAQQLVDGGQRSQCG